MNELLKTSTKRPPLIWLIILWFVITSMYAIYCNVRLSGSFSSALAILGNNLLGLYAFSIVDSVLALTSSYMLFARKFVAARFLIAFFMVRLINFIWVSNTDNLKAMFSSTEKSMIFEVIMLLFFITYIRILKMRGNYFIDGSAAKSP